jgi:uncharacterized protein (TIGR03083 family)
MAHETAVHRWDMEAAHGVAGPIDGDLARDGIDEVFDVMVPADRPDSEVPAHGESYHFHRTDGPGEWAVQFEGSEVSVRHEHVKADVAVRGTASDLLLFLWRRIPPDDVEILGDRDVVQRYFELVPPS